MGVVVVFVIDYTLVAVSWIVAITVSYYLRKFYQQRHTAIVSKRQYSLVLLINALAITYLFIFFPGRILFIDHKHEWFYDVFFGYCLLCGVHVMGYSILFRLWLVHYDTKWTVASKTFDVLKYINDESPGFNWYITNKHKYGNFNNALKFFYIPCTVSCVVVCIVYTFLGGYSRRFAICNGSILCVPLICGIIIWNKTPIFNDYFKILIETRFTLFGCGIGIGVYTVINAIGLFYTTSFKLCELVAFFVLIFLFGHLCLFTTLWVLEYSGLFLASLDTDDHEEKQYKNVNKCNCCVSSSVSTPLSHAELLISVQMQHRLTKTSDKNANIHLSDVLRNKDGFDLFVIHLVHEFSFENILAVIEFTQFSDFYNKKYSNVMDDTNGDNYDSGISLDVNVLTPSLKQYNSDDSQNNDSKNNKNIKLAKHVPRSDVVWSEELLMIDKIQKIMEKYVFNGAKFEINVPGYLRNECINKYQKLVLGEVSEQDCCNIFEPVCRNVTHLMKDSFYRFQRTEQYQIFLFKLNNVST